MKYQLPKNLKTHGFPCALAKSVTNYKKCTNCTLTNDALNCWKKNIKEYLIKDCISNNLINNNIKNQNCPYCNSTNITHALDNSYLCANCGSIFEFYDKTKNEAINYQELNNLLANIK